MRKLLPPEGKCTRIVHHHNYFFKRAWFKKNNTKYTMVRLSLSNQTHLPST
jgi:hypothetical protein